jgi:serine/threonine protein kinase/Tfp pilus assembly protein PilF
MPPAPGTRLGPYDILAPLGKGGMGEVWRARDPRLGREVAIKVLPADVARDADRLARFEREARAVAALNHPNLVTLHSIEESEGVRFLTMELVEGESLDRVVVPGGLPLPRVLELTIPIADALAAAHTKGIVHRDLKPANVMVSREGRVKVLDFGLAKLARDDVAAGAAGLAGATAAPTMDAPISAMGLVVGTAPYMAPEQLRGEPVDARTDLFALGVLLYELATGRRPFGGATTAEVTSAILRDTPPPLSSVRADAPPDLERILARCLEKDPERRVQTAKDVRNELELLRRAGAPGAAPFRAAAATPAESPSVAVLPFANRSADPADEYFSEGLADELLSTLVKIRSLRVAARTSAGTFKGKAVTIEEIGRALNVASVLEGSVRKAGNRVRISVQLVKVADGASLWSETYDRTLDDIFAVQDDIAQSVVKELRTTLLGEDPDSDASDAAHAEVAVAARGRGENAESHRLYLQGKYFVDRFTGPDTDRGVAYLEQAIALDPGNALALSQLARAHTMRAGYGWETPEEGAARARDYAQRALALAPDLAEAHIALANVQGAYDLDWRLAEASVRRALALEPANPIVLASAGAILQQVGRAEEAIPLLERAVELDPLSPRACTTLGLVYRVEGRLAEAERMYRKALELSPERMSAWHMIALILAESGRDAEALAAAQREPSPWARLTALAYVHARAGRMAESGVALAELEAHHFQESALQIAALHAARGEADAAFEWLERTLAQHDAGIAHVYTDPIFQWLHDDPRWEPLLRKAGFVD